MNASPGALAEGSPVSRLRVKGRYHYPVRGVPF